MKIHGPHGIADSLDSFDSPAAAIFDNDPSHDVSAASAPARFASPALTQVLYLAETPNTNAITVGDINQGQIGDCFLLSPIGELALLKPTSIMNMIHVNANGTESVTLYEASNGRLPGWNTTAFKPISETVSNVFPNDAVNNRATQDVSMGRKEIWPQVLEKAVATLNGGYGAIANGGSPVMAMEELTGHAASFMSPASLSLATLQRFSAAGDLVVMDTLSSGALPNGLFNSHAYMFEGVTGTGATALVHLGNPWGFDQPTAMLVSQLPRGFAEVDVGHLS